MANYNLGEARGKIVLETDLKSLKDGQDAINNAKKNAEDAASAQQGAWKKTGTAAVVAGGVIAAGFAVAVKSASDFEFQLSAIQAVSGNTAQEMDLIRQTALRIGKDTAFSASEAASAMEELAKAGISTKDILGGAADATVALAAAGGVDLPTAATLAANAMNQFGLSAKDMVNVTNKIAGAANASAIDVGEYGQSLQQVGAVAHLAGLSFDDTTLAIAAMGNAGIKGSDAGTSLKTMLMNLQPQTKQAADLMKQLGLITADGSNQFYDATGKLKSLTDISAVMTKALEGMTQAQKQQALATLFGSDAVRGAAVITATGAAGFEKLSKAIDKTSAADVAATRMNNMKGSVEQLKGSVETLFIQIGTMLIPVIRKMIDGLNDAVGWFTSLSDGTKVTIASVTGAAAGMLLLFGATIKTIQAIQTATAVIQALNIAQSIAAAKSAALTVAIVAMYTAEKVMAIASKVAAAAQWLWNAALTANPIGIIIAAIAALVAGLIWFFTQTKLGKEIWANVTKTIVAAWQWLVNAAQVVWNAILTAVKAVVDWFGKYVWPGIKFVIDLIVAYFQMYYNIVVAIWNGIMTAVRAVADWFMTYVWPTLKAVIDFLVKLFNYLWQVVVAVWQLIYSAISTVVGAIVSFLVDAWNNFLLGWQIIWSAVSKVVTDVWNAIVSWVMGIVTPIVTWLATQWNNFLIGWNIIWNAVKKVITDIWNGIVAFLMPIVLNIWNFIRNTWSGITSFVDGVFKGVKKAIVDPITDALKFISGIKDKIIGFFAGAGKWLWDAGKNIIDGFLKGLQSMWNEVGNFFRDLTKMIPDTKGPPQKDKVLLTENGRLIMRSLYNGLASEMGNVQDLLNGMNATIPANITQQITLGANSKNNKPGVILNLEYHAAPGDGTKTKEDLMAMLGHATELVRKELP